MREKQLIQQIETTSSYKEYKKAHPDAYLAHIFIMEKGKREEPEAGFYDPASENITTFTIERQTGSDKGFGEDKIKELNILEVRVSLDDALKQSESVLKEIYKGQPVTQKICILQHLETQVWNITLITANFQMINIRIDAASGKVLKHEAHSIMDLGR